MEEMNVCVDVLGSSHVKFEIFLWPKKQELIIFMAAMVLMLAHLHFYTFF